MRLDQTNRWSDFQNWFAKFLDWFAICLGVEVLCQKGELAIEMVVPWYDLASGSRLNFKGSIFRSHASRLEEAQVAVGPTTRTLRHAQWQSEFVLVPVELVRSQDANFGGWLSFR